MRIEELIKLDDRIRSEIFQIDIYKNGKFQSLFATGNQIHLVARNGKYVSGFPTDIPSTGGIQHLGLIDYSGKGEYRIAATDSQGDIYLVNAKGEILDGWNPRSFDEAQSIALRHLRVRNRDFMLTLESEGEFHLLKRIGKYYPNFPLDLKTKLAKGINIKKGSQFDNTVITLLSTSGELIRLNLNGKILGKKQFPRNSVKSEFMLINAIGDRDFIVMSRDETGFTVFDSKGEEQFRNENLNSTSLEVQYYSFSSGSLIFVVDEERSDLYIYNGKGEMQVTEILKSSKPISLIKSSREGNVLYKAYQDQFEVVNF